MTRALILLARFSLHFSAFLFFADLDFGKQWPDGRTLENFDSRYGTGPTPAPDTADTEGVADPPLENTLNISLCVE